MVAAAGEGIETQGGRYRAALERHQHGGLTVWRAWYAGGSRFSSATSKAEQLPLAGLLLVVVYEGGEKRIYRGEFIWHKEQWGVADSVKECPQEARIFPAAERPSGEAWTRLREEVLASEWS